MEIRLRRRKEERKRKRIPIRFGNNDLRFRAFTMDISANGLSIKTNQVFPPGTPLMLMLIVDGKPLTAKGEVIWAKRVPPELIRFVHCGMGIRLTLTSDRLREYIQTIKGVPHSVHL
jgi:Tfp pilus assembly protein PilZ